MIKIDCMLSYDCVNYELSVSLIAEICTVTIVMLYRCATLEIPYTYNSLPPATANEKKIKRCTSLNIIVIL